MASRAERAMSFGSIAEDYDRLRPTPPPEALDWLVPAGCQVAVDVAAGTGLFTRALLGRAERVIAVEPDDRMRAVLAERTPAVEAVAGAGEEIPLPDAAADANLGLAGNPHAETYVDGHSDPWEWPETLGSAEG